MIHIYIYIHTYTLYLYIYIYIERERDVYTYCVYIYIYIGDGLCNIRREMLGPPLNPPARGNLSTGFLDYILRPRENMVGVDMVLAQHPQNTLHHRIYIIHD